MLGVVIAPPPSAALAAALGGDPSGRAAAGAAAGAGAVLSVVAVAAAAVGKKRGASSSASSATASAKQRPDKTGKTLSKEHMLHSENGSVMSIVHAFDKKHGFFSNDDDGTSSDPLVEMARTAHRLGGITKKKSHPQIIERWAKFERFMLEYHPDCDYSKWLLSLLTETSSVFKVRKRNAQLHSRHHGLT